MLLAVGALAVGVFQIAYQLSIDAVGVPTTVALLYLAPALVVAASGPLLGNGPPGPGWSWRASSTLGVWLCVLGAETSTRPSDRRGSDGACSAASATRATCSSGGSRPRGGVAVPTMVYSTAALGGVLSRFPAADQRPHRASGQLPRMGAPGRVRPPDHRRGPVPLLRRARPHRGSAGPSSPPPPSPLVAALLATTLLSQGLDPLGWAGAGAGGGSAWPGSGVDRCNGRRFQAGARAGSRPPAGSTRWGRRSPPRRRRRARCAARCVPPIPSMDLRACGSPSPSPSSDVE